MNALVKKLPDIEDPTSRQFDSVHQDLEPVSGKALRYLRHFLDEKDPEQCWGHLERVQTPEGDYLWLCEKHAAEYKK